MIHAFAALAQHNNLLILGKTWRNDFYLFIIIVTIFRGRGRNGISSSNYFLD